MGGQDARPPQLQIPTPPVIYATLGRSHTQQKRKTAITALARTVIAVINPPKPIKGWDCMAVIS